MSKQEFNITEQVVLAKQWITICTDYFNHTLEDLRKAWGYSSVFPIDRVINEPNPVVRRLYLENFANYIEGFTVDGGTPFIWERPDLAFESLGGEADEAAPVALKQYIPDARRLFPYHFHKALGRLERAPGLPIPGPSQWPLRSVEDEMFDQLKVPPRHWAALRDDPSWAQALHHTAKAGARAGYLTMQLDSANLLHVKHTLAGRQLLWLEMEDEVRRGILEAAQRSYDKFYRDKENNDE